MKPILTFLVIFALMFATLTTCSGLDYSMAPIQQIAYTMTPTETVIDYGTGAVDIMPGNIITRADKSMPLVQVSDRCESGVCDVTTGATLQPAVRYAGSCSSCASASPAQRRPVVRAVTAPARAIIRRGPIRQMFARRPIRRVFSRRPVRSFFGRVFGVFRR